jgi:hypothetical protein
VPSSDQAQLVQVNLIGRDIQPAVRPMRVEQTVEAASDLERLPRRA